MSLWWLPLRNLCRFSKVRRRHCSGTGEMLFYMARTKNTWILIHLHMYITPKDPTPFPGGKKRIILQINLIPILPESRNLGVNAITLLGPLQEIRWHIFCQLILLRPLPELLEIAALVLSVEVNEWLWMVRVGPDLAKDAHVDGAHELLPQDVEAVCYSVKRFPLALTILAWLLGMAMVIYVLTWRLTMNSSFLKAPSPRSR